MKRFFPAFSLEQSEKYDLLTNKISEYLLNKLNNWIESLNAEKIKIRHSSNVKDDAGFIKIEEENNQFLIDKILVQLNKNNLYVISMEKKTEVMLEIEKTIGYVEVSTNPCSLTLQVLLQFSTYISHFVEIQYIHSLEPDAIKQLDNDIRADGCGVESVVDIQSSFELLTIFQLFYYFNSRLLLTNGLFHQCLMENHLQVPKNITKKAL